MFGLIKCDEKKEKTRDSGSRGDLIPRLADDKCPQKRYVNFGSPGAFPSHPPSQFTKAPPLGGQRGRDVFVLGVPYDVWMVIGAKMEPGALQNTHGPRILHNAPPLHVDQIAPPSGRRRIRRAGRRGIGI